MTPSHDRFTELHDLLQAYEWTGNTFDDTTEAPGTALGSYLRVAAYAPQRAATAVREIDDLLATGLFSDEIADDVDLLPHIYPSQGISVEDCLRIVRHHLANFLASPPPPEPSARPAIRWEWRKRFPALAHLLGAYFYQDCFEIEYESHTEAVNDYLASEAHEDLEKAASEIPEFLALNPEDTELKEAAGILGLWEPTPKGISLRQWLTDIQGIITRHLRP